MSDARRFDHHTGSSAGRRRGPLPGRVLQAWLLLTLVLGCGGIPTDPGNPEPALGVARSPEEGCETNGLLTNGLITNGLITNGLITNGLVTNGLAAGGLSSDSFGGWFTSNPEPYSNMVMKYLVLCALPAGQQLTWTSPASGNTYVWTGALGLTPGWASGQPATEVEEQLITACLGALVNKYGLHVEISIMGEDARGVPIPVGPTELWTFSVPEACFFGNLFTGEGVYSASLEYPLGFSKSSIRTCGLLTWRPGSMNECAPLAKVGMIGSAHCQLQSGTPYYATCTYHGKTYRPLTTRIQPQDIYRCGDGICQITEHCGTGTTPDNCLADCGPCPQ